MVLVLIKPHDLDSRSDATAKTIHKDVILIAGKFKSEKCDKLSQAPSNSERGAGK